jgi:hypothetical protein
VSRKYPEKGSARFQDYDTQCNHHIAYRNLLKTPVLIFLSGLIFFVITACARQPTPYRPPTIAARVTLPVEASATPSPTVPAVETPQPEATQACTDNLTFLEDLSLPDGTVVKPGESLDKRWLVQNSGTCNWDERYRLKFNSGAELGAEIDQALYPARGGTQANLRIIFTAPTNAGSYQSAWQAYNPQGQAFGDIIYLQVEVASTNP